MRVLYFCGKCQMIAENSCLYHRHLIEIIRGNEIDLLPRRRRLECQNCFKINFSSTKKVECLNCKSTRHRLI